MQGSALLFNHVARKDSLPFKETERGQLLAVGADSFWTCLGCINQDGKHQYFYNTVTREPSHYHPNTTAGSPKTKVKLDSSLRHDYLGTPLCTVAAENG